MGKVTEGSNIFTAWTVVRDAEPSISHFSGNMKQLENNILMHQSSKETQQILCLHYLFNAHKISC